MGDAPGTSIPLHSVNSKIMSKVIEFCEYHHQFPILEDEKEQNSEDIIPWDKDFCNVDQSTLFELIIVRLLVKYKKIQLFFFRLLIFLKSKDYLTLPAKLLPT